MSWYSNVFCCEYCEFFKSRFFIENLRWLFQERYELLKKVQKQTLAEVQEITLLKIFRKNHGIAPMMRLQASGLKLKKKSSTPSPMFWKNGSLAKIVEYISKQNTHKQNWNHFLSKKLLFNNIARWKIIYCLSAGLRFVYPKLIKN